ncbi:MAG: hypothetical protein PUD93_03705 [Lachnospiraceae bacterium]|nr:hypothetical protein [Lachnospiraceae bacterium]
MKAELKKDLQEAFDAPKPLAKESFMQTIPGAQISYREFILYQVSYIRKWGWVISILIFAAGIASALVVDKDAIWVLSALMPFVALFLVTENARSVAYGMEELEMASRFSLKSVVLARLEILGVFHTVLLALFLPVNALYDDYSLLQTGIYLLVPYLMSTSFGLWIVRRMRGKEAFYACAGAATLVSVLQTALKSGAAFLFEQRAFIWWILTFIILLLWTIAECRQMVRQKEDFLWNLL